jgi:hypothetical protein
MLVAKGLNSPGQVRANEKSMVFISLMRTMQLPGIAGNAT